MFYKSGGIIRKNILKPRKKFSAMGLGASNMANLRKLGVLEQNTNFKMAYEGYTVTNFMFEIRLVRYLGHPFAKL